MADAKHPNEVRDTITIRRIINQACMDHTRCNVVCAKPNLRNTVTCCGSGTFKVNRNNWWVGSGKIPCFVCSHNLNKVPIHPQDPMR